MLTNGACFAGLQGIRDLLAFDDESVSMAVMPQFHVAGGFWGLVAGYLGRPTVLQREVDPVGIVDLIAQHRVTHAVYVPALLQFLNMVPGIADADLSSLRCIVYGASPISEEVLVASIKTFGCDFLQAYGMTETSGGCVFLPPADHDLDGPNRHRLRAAGLPWGDTELKIVDAELQEVPVGEVGEILIRQPQNMVGYWNQPEATAATILAGRLPAHRRRRLSGRGRLPLHPRPREGHDHLGRRERVPGRGGEPAHGPPRGGRLRGDRRARREVGRDAEGPRRPHARTPRSPRPTCIEFAREGLAKFKCPTSVEWRDELPRNPSGKLLKNQLREPYWKGKDRRVG